MHLVCVINSHYTRRDMQAKLVRQGKLITHDKSLDGADNLLSKAETDGGGTERSTSYRGILQTVKGNPSEDDAFDKNIE